MRKAQFLALVAVLAFAAISNAQTPSTNQGLLNQILAKGKQESSKSFLDAPCGAVLKQAWDLERKLENTYLSQTPATDAQGLLKEADEFNAGPLGDCEGATYETDPPLHEALLAEAGNLAYIHNAELSTGGTGGLPEGSADDFPEDLGDVAPACKPVLASRLPQRIEALTGQHQGISAVEGEDASRFFAEAEPSYDAGLLICAGQAGQAGYKDVEIRLLTDELMLYSGP